MYFWNFTKSVIIIIILLIFEFISADKSTLKYSQAICRHGNRNPENTFGIYELNNATIWPEGIGELTPLGKKQLYGVGKFFRDRYHNFLSEAYDANEISIVSSANDRTIKSAYSLAQGLFKKFNDDACWGNIDSRTLPHEPIPIRTMPKEVDNCLALTINCPKRLQLLHQSRDGSFNSFTKKYFEETDILETIFSNTGITDNVFDKSFTGNDVQYHVYSVMEVITVLNEQSKPLEDWMKSLVSNEKFLSYQYNLWADEHLGGIDSGLAKLNSGGLLKMILDNIQGFLQGEHHRKFDVFSAHDFTLTNLAFALEMESALENRVSPPSSCFIIEVHEYSEHGSPAVEFWYWNGAKNRVKRAIALKCGNPCLLEELQNATDEIVNVDYNKECQL